MLHKKIAGLSFATALLISIMLSAARPARGAPLEVYGRLPGLENVALSPGGTRLALVRTSENHRILMVISLTERKPLGKYLNLGDLKLRSVDWADDDHLMIISSSTSLPMGLIGRVQEWYMLSVLDVNTQKFANYPDPEKFNDLRIMNVLSGRIMVRHIDGHTV